MATEMAKKWVNKNVRSIQSGKSVKKRKTES